MLFFSVVLRHKVYRLSTISGTEAFYILGKLNKNSLCLPNYFRGNISGKIKKKQLLIVHLAATEREKFRNELISREFVLIIVLLGLSNLSVWTSARFA